MTDGYRYATPAEAEAAFYAAFAAADLDAMMRVWADTDDTICIHPMGERLIGNAAIAASWSEIFRGDGSMRFELAETIDVSADSLAVRYVYEEISFGADFGERSRVLATNVFVRTDAGWRIHAHHGSPGVRVVPRAAPPPQTVH